MSFFFEPITVAGDIDNGALAFLSIAEFSGQAIGAGRVLNKVAKAENFAVAEKSIDQTKYMKTLRNLSKQAKGATKQSFELVLNALKSAAGAFGRISRDALLLIGLPIQLGLISKHDMTLRLMRWRSQFGQKVSDAIEFVQQGMDETLAVMFGLVKKEDDPRLAWAFDTIQTAKANPGRVTPSILSEAREYFINLFSKRSDDIPPTSGKAGDLPNETKTTGKKAPDSGDQAAESTGDASKMS